MAPAICCSAEDIVDADSTAVPNVRQPVIQSRTVSGQPSDSGDDPSDSVIHIKAITDIFASATATNHDHTDTATTSSKATRQSKLHMIKKRFSRDSAIFKLSHQKDHVQRKPPTQLLPKKTRLHITASETDILANRTPSHGGYDKDARLMDDCNVAAVARESPDEPELAVHSASPVEQQAFSEYPNEDDVFTSLPQTFSGAPRLPSITSTSISIHWPTTPHSHGRTISQSSDIVAAVEDLFPKPRRSVQTNRDIAQPTLKPLPTIFASDRAPDSAAREEHLPTQLDDVQSVLGLSTCVTDQHESAPQPRRPRPATGLYDAPENHSESSLHLYTMRISQHLRSLSNLSTDSSAAGPNGHPSRIGSDLDEPLINREHAQSNPQRLVSTAQMAIHPPATTFNSGTVIKLVPEIAIGKHGKKALALNSIVNMKNTLFQSPKSQIREALNSTQVLDNGKSSKTYDGPAEHHLSTADAQHALQAETRTRQKSISENYDDAATLWGKALGAYADEVADRRRSSRSLSTSSRSKWNLAVQEVSRRPGLSPRKFSTASNQSVESHKARSRAGSMLALKPLQTQHTFDKLAVTQDSTRNQSPTHEATGNFTFPLGLLHGRRRSKSHPHLGDDYTFPQRPKHAKLQEEDLDVTEGPTITVTDTEVTQSTRETTKALARHRSGSSLAAWSRYPSHTRHERSFSAGMLDNIIARDFADAGSPIDDTSDDGTEKQRTAKKAKSKARNAGRRKKFLSDLPRFFKSYGTGNNKPARGHRSSIAVGDPLEFPELELIAGGGIQYTPVNNAVRRDSATFDTGSPRPRRKSVKITGPSESSSAELHQQRPVELVRLGSSNYGSAGDRGMAQTEGNTFPDGPYDVASDWPGFYASAVDIPRSDSHAYSEQPTGDESNNAGTSSKELATFLSPRSPRCDSPGAKSLPPTFAMSKTDDECVELRNERKKLRQSISAQPMRRSTQDLLTKLDMEEGAEMARALRTAETVWDS